MSLTTAPSTPAPSPTARSLRPVVARWLVSFLGFPLGGFAALLLLGAVDSVPRAVAGGLITGVVLGAGQAWALRTLGRRRLAWVLATAVGLAGGLTLGTSLVGFATGLADLVVQGAVTGAAVGIAQAVVLWSRVGRLALVWPAYLTVVWAAGWAVSTAIGIDVAAQFAVFGAAGAVTVTVLTAVLPVLLHRSTQR